MSPIKYRKNAAGMLATQFARCYVRMSEGDESAASDMGKLFDDNHKLVIMALRSYAGFDTFEKHLP